MIRFIFPILLLITSSSCFCQDSIRCNLYNRYQISAVKTGKINENLIKILDQQLNRSFDWGVIQNYCNHRSEFHDSSLYVIKEFDYNNKKQLIRDKIGKVILYDNGRIEVNGYVFLFNLNMAYEPISRDCRFTKRWKVHAF